MLVSTSDMDNRIIAYPEFVVQETTFAKRKHGSRICHNAKIKHAVLCVRERYLHQQLLLTLVFRRCIKRRRKRKINKPGTSSSSDAILVSTKESCWPIRAMLALVPPKLFDKSFDKARTTFVRIFVRYSVTAGENSVKILTMASVRLFRGVHQISSLFRPGSSLCAPCSIGGFFSFRRYNSERWAILKALNQAFKSELRLNQKLLVSLLI